jgi:hypothetical protein
MPVETREKNQSQRPGLIDIDEDTPLRKPAKKPPTAAQKRKAEEQQAKAEVKKAKLLDQLAKLEAEQRARDEGSRELAAQPPSLLTPEVVAAAKRGGMAQGGRGRGGKAGAGSRGGKKAASTKRIVETEVEGPPEPGDSHDAGDDNLASTGPVAERAESPEPMDVDDFQPGVEEPLVSKFHFLAGL